MSAKFDFYERVKVISDDAEVKKLKYTLGTVNGKAENEDGAWSYSVSLDMNGETWCFDEDEIESIGAFANKEDSQPVGIAKVVVTPDGTGKIKDD